MNYLKSKITILLTVITLVVVSVSCGDDDPVPVPVEPTFAVSEASELEVGYTIAFSAEELDGATAYQWSFGDGGSATGSETTHVYNEANSYTVTLEVTVNGDRRLVSNDITIGINNSELFFIDNDAGKMRKVVIGDTLMISDVFDLPGFCIGMAYDEVNGTLYYSDDDNGAVLSNDIAGGAETTIVSTFDGVGLDGPRDLAVDAANNTLYFTERFLDRIIQVDLSNNTPSVLYSSDDDPDFLLPVGLDLYDGNLYATAVEVDAESVWKGNIDGSGISRIVDFNAGGFGYGIEVDEENEKLYFDDNDGNRLLTASLDGSGVTAVGSTTDRTYGIAVFNEIGKLFWVGRDGIIYRSNLDGSEEERFFTVGADVRGLIIRKVD